MICHSVTLEIGDHHHQGQFNLLVGKELIVPFVDECNQLDYFLDKVRLCGSKIKCSGCPVEISNELYQFG